MPRGQASRSGRRGSWGRRLLGLLWWLASAFVVAVSVPTPLGPAHLGVTGVAGTSMLPTYDPGDLVLTWRRASYPAGTPVVYRIPRGEAGAGLNVVHRVVRVRANGLHVMQGDNNDAIDPWQPLDSDVRGAVVVRVPRGAQVLSMLTTPLTLGVFSGLMLALAVFDWLRTRGSSGDGTPPEGPEGPAPPRRRKRHRRPTPVATRGAVVAAALALTVGVVPASAAPIGGLSTASLYASSTPASVAANPVSYQQTLESETATQYCATVVVTNHSTQAVQWEVTLDISAAPYNAATIASSYNVTTVSFTATAWRVHGVDWNAALGAGQSYTWGYCADRPVPGLTDATATASVTSFDQSSYCATVTVSTASATWVRWKVSIGHATAGLTDTVYWLAAAPTSFNNMAQVSFDAATGTWVVRGSGSNEYVKSGSTATFGFCAPSGAAATYADATVSVSLSNQDASSYCADVTVSTASATWVRWRATIDHTTANLTGAQYWLNAAPTDLTSVQTLGFDAATGAWQAVGLSYNQLIKAGSPATWRFCSPKNASGDVYVDATVSVVTRDFSASNYCATVTVSTTSPTDIAWRGTINHTTPGLTSSAYWLTSAPSTSEAVTVSFDAATGTWVFKGASYNSTVKAGSPVSFGFCATPNPTGTPVVATASATVNGTCADVTVSTTSTDWVRWQAVINHSTPGLTSSGNWLTTQPTNFWNATSISFTAATGTWVLQGASFNMFIKAGSPATFGYCR